MKAGKGNLWFVVKLLMSLCFIAVLFNKWADVSEVWSGILLFFSSKTWIIVAALLLVPLNWSLESFKWKVLFRKVMQVSFIEAVKHVLAGVAVGFITPARSGEFAGRMMLLPSHAQLASVYFSFIGGIAQLLPGILFVLLYSFFSTAIFEDRHTVQILLLMLFLVVSVVYFFSQSLFNLFPFSYFLKKLSVDLSYNPDIKQHLVVLLLSFIRFIVYTFQFQLILFASGISFYDSFFPVCTVFLLQAFSPAIAMLDFGFRGSVAYFIFSKFGLYNPLILPAVFLIWFINLCLPALLGYFFILSHKSRKCSSQIPINITCK